MTTRQRQTRSHTRTNRSMRFNQLVELTSALSEADKDTKEKVETAEILSLLGFAGRGGRKNESTAATQTTRQPTAAAITRSIPQQQQQQLPLPSIQHIAVQPAQAVAQQPRQQQQAIRPAVAKLPIKPVAVPVLPAAATAAATKSAATPTRAGARSATHGVEGEKKRKRSKTTPEQLRILMDEFQREPMPNATTRQTLAARLDMTPRSVQIWFQNMRAKVKKANSGSAPGDEKKSGSGSTSPSLADTESDGPAKKRQRTVTGEEDKNNSDKMVIEQPQSRRNSVTGPSPSSPVAIPAPVKPAAAPQSSAALNAKPAQQQPIKIAASPQTSTFAPANAASLAKPRSAEATQPTTTGKLPLPVIQHHPHIGQPIFGVSLQYIPQSYHCDQLKRATMAALSGSVQHQMTA